MNKKFFFLRPSYTIEALCENVENMIIYKKIAKSSVIPLSIENYY